MRVRAISVIGDSHPRLEDFWCVDFNGQRLKAAVGDWANNLVGGPYEDLETAIALNETGQRYNGGVIGAKLAEKTIRGSEAVGHNLLALMNNTLARKYEQLNITNYAKQRALTFTGYIAHIIATPQQATITAVGDVRIAADGRLLAGKKKKNQSKK